MFTIKKYLDSIKYHLFFIIGYLTNNKWKMKDLKISPETSYVLDRHLYTHKYIVNNNKWGIWKISKKYQQNYTQLINKSGWITQTPLRNYGVIGYPCIKYDKNVIKIKDIKNHIIDYDVNILKEPNKKFNLAFDFWISTENRFRWETISHEIMIWEDYFASNPFGNFYEEIEVSGEKYRVYEGLIDKSEEDIPTDGWHYICFLKVNKTNKNNIDVKGLLDYLVKTDLLSNEHYLLQSEFGTEIYNSTLKLQINKFEYNIE